MDDRNLLVTVVVSVKRDARVYRLIQSLLDQTVPMGTYEIIVVENGSHDLADVGTLGGGVVRYLHAEEANMAAARNMGLNTARGRYLLMTDADCIVSPDWIRHMTGALRSGSAEIVGGPIKKYKPRTFTQRHGITVVDGQQRLNYLPALSLPYVAGANAGFMTEKLREVGGFDEAFKSGSDVDICYRLGLQGCRVGLLPQAIVLHEDRVSVREHYRRFRDYAVYQVLLYAKYKQVSGKRFVVNRYPFERAVRALASIPSALMSVFRGDTDPASELFLQLVEAIGIWCGDFRGSIRYRQLYI